MRADGGDRAYVSLEGGGAKGIVHVGALLAVERFGYDVKGVSGTSAGAIVAALYAAGYRPEEILDPESPRTILDEVEGADTAIDLLGARAWNRLAALRRISNPLQLLGAAAIALPLTLGQFLVDGKTEQVAAILALGAAMLASQFFTVFRLVLYVLFFLLLPVSLSLWIGPEYGAVAVVIQFAAAYRYLWGLFRGLASLKKFRDTIGLLLARKVGRQAIPEAVRFRDFGPGTGRPSLKIVATNISRGRMELFSPELTPDAPVADAVAASGCIPIAFGPWRIEEGLEDGRRDLFLDGGIVSNMPAWAFDPERSLDPDAVSFIAGTGDEGAPKEPRGLLGWTERVARTAIFGSRSLSVRGVQSAIHVTGQTELGVLELDVTAERARRTVRDALKSAEARIGYERDIAKASAQIRDYVVAILEANGLFDTATDKARVCVCAVPQETMRAMRRNPGAELPLRLAHHAGFEDSADFGLHLPLARSCMGQALTTGATQFVDLTASGGDYLSAPQDRMARIRTGDGLSWLLAIPISVLDRLNGESRSFAVSVDCDADLPDSEESLGVLLECCDWIEQRVHDSFLLLGDPSGGA